DELKRLGYEPVDAGPKAMGPADDYPDYGRPVAHAVSKGIVKRGVLTCGTGLGMAYVANRFPRVRAAVAWTPEIAELARKHNDANVLVLPSRFVSEEEGMAILHRWLDTGFEGGRHARRGAKIEHDCPARAPRSGRCANPRPDPARGGAPGARARADREREFRHHGRDGSDR